MDKKRDCEAETKNLDAAEEKIASLRKNIEHYKKELDNLKIERREHSLFREFAEIMASAKTKDELFKKTIENFSTHLKASYLGFFLLDNNGMFQFYYGKGYIPGAMPAIPQVGSIMGEALHLRETISIQNLRIKTDFIALNQDPKEHNLICVPLVLFNSDYGVLRIANCDDDTRDLGRRTIPTIASLLCSMLERLQLESLNSQAKQGLEASLAITRSLENTISEKEILEKTFSQIPKLFACKACVLAIKTDEVTLKPIFTWPMDFALGGNPHSMLIYLKNLLETFPGGTGLIPDIHKERRWSWSNRDVKSLAMTGLHLHKILKAVIVVLSPWNSPFTSNQTDLLGLAAAQTSITLERASYFRKQEELASYDGLTGLFNHRVFQEHIRNEVDRCRRYNRPVSLFMFDIDNFKKFNDTYGHPVGDEILKMVSRTARTGMRTTDRVYRYGGEEFCIILPETSSENGFIVADRFRKKIELNHSVRNLFVTISGGISAFQNSDSLEQFLKRVDDLLYKSKQSGKNRITLG